MSEPLRQLTIDEAVSEFHALLQEQLGGDPGDGPGDGPVGDWAPPATQEEAEARHFRMAEHLVGLACPDPAACGDPRCRRDALCRHLAHVRTRQAAGKSSHPRRPPGADALRYAIWVYMSSRSR
jgi:hypothetical protein